MLFVKVEETNEREQTIDQHINSNNTRYLKNIMVVKQPAIISINNNSKKHSRNKKNRNSQMFYETKENIVKIQ